MTQRDDNDLTAAIVAIYQSPLEEFVTRRDARVKELRAAKRRDDAALVKLLRKPSRMAWLLDQLAHDDAGPIAHLTDAITTAQSAKDLRAALEAVKESVRAVAAAGARVAIRAGNPVEPNAVAAAVHAIIGDAAAFAEWRAGRLVDVPTGGGLDLLSVLTPQPPPERSSAKPEPLHHEPDPVHREPEPAKPDPRIALAESMRAALRRAEELVVVARGTVVQAADAVRDAGLSVDAAEQAVSRAQSELEERRANAERLRQRAEAATAQLEDAEQSVAKARSRVAELEELS